MPLFLRSSFFIVEQTEREHQIKDLVRIVKVASQRFPDSVYPVQKGASMDIQLFCGADCVATVIQVYT